MLIANFYNVISHESTGEMAWTVKVELNPGHGIYQGHFPGNPVLPGVCTLQIIKECVAGQLNRAYQYDQVNSCKYLSAIHPTQTPKLELNLAVKPLDDGQLQLTAEGRAEGTHFIKLKATLSPR